MANDAQEFTGASLAFPPGSGWAGAARVGLCSIPALRQPYSLPSLLFCLFPALFTIRCCLFQAGPRALLPEAEDKSCLSLRSPTPGSNLSIPRPGDIRSQRAPAPGTVPLRCSGKASQRRTPANSGTRPICDSISRSAVLVSGERSEDREQRCPHTCCRR